MVHKNVSAEIKIAAIESAVVIELTHFRACLRTAADYSNKLIGDPDDRLS